LKDKNILVGITGGIAAYKIPLLVRDFVKAGARVRVAMTESAAEFIAPLTLSTLSGNRVAVGSFPRPATDSGTWHIELASWADLMLIAPATANTIAKLAQGISDNAVTTLALAMRGPTLISPAMDRDMWLHPATQSNILRLKELGYILLPPEEGELASGLTGPGRLPHPEKILNAVAGVFKNAHKDLLDKKILVTAGPTREPVDPVRYLGNRSSGKMGFAIANAAAQRGASVTLVSGPVSLETPRNVQRVDVETAAEMYQAVMKRQRGMNAVIMAAAVADFAPAAPAVKKIKKEEVPAGLFHIECRRTKDILHQLGVKKKDSILVGFALETDNEISGAKKKLRDKNLDYIVLNNPAARGAGFETDTNIVTIISKSGHVERLRKMAKFDVANEILSRISKRLAAGK